MQEGLRDFTRSINPAARNAGAHVMPAIGNEDEIYFRSCTVPRDQLPSNAVYSRLTDRQILVM